MYSVQGENRAVGISENPGERGASIIMVGIICHPVGIGWVNWSPKISWGQLPPPYPFCVYGPAKWTLGVFILTRSDAYTVDSFAKYRPDIIVLFLRLPFFVKEWLWSNIYFSIKKFQFYFLIQYLLSNNYVFSFRF